MPQSNQRNLILNQDVVEALEAGQFHIYCVSHVDEAMHLLLDREPGEANSDGEFPEGSVNGEIIARLKAIAEMSEKSSKD